MKHKIAAILASVLCGGTAFAQTVTDLLKVRSGTLTSKWETTEKREYVLNYENKDFCDYYVTRQDALSAIARPGNSLIFKTDNHDEVNNFLRTSTGYRYYKGSPVSKFNPAFPYALPVRDGAAVRMIQDKRQPVRSYAFLIREGEPVYAMRSGKVCLCDDPRCLLVYHKDGTFAAYIGFESTSVGEGLSVRTGDEIGTCGKSRLCVSFFFLDPNKLDGKVYPYTHFTPYVRTSEGDVKLPLQQDVTAVVDADIISMDMGKAARKKFIKKHSGE
ncbi:MAG: peptidoglycan DD-metalloendopeptidase family protein [Bacteroidales bacterium]|nr:peptidoglycan DD-metalloendopeptidase family protein [Bacteroidales bacterium]